MDLRSSPRAPPPPRRPELTWFLTHPAGEIHINKLAREIGVSPGSVKSYADAFERDGLITVTPLGTANILGSTFGYAWAKVYIVRLTSRQENP